MKRLRIAIDTTYMDRRPAKGTAILIRHAIEQLKAYRDEFDITLVHRERIPEDLLYEEFDEIVIPRLALPKFSGFFSELRFFLTIRERFDVYYFSYSRLYPIFWLAPAKRIMFLAMDGGPQTSGYKGAAKTPFPWWFNLVSGRVDMFCAISEFGRRGIMQACDIPEERTAIIPCGVGEGFKPAPSEDSYEIVRTRYGLPAPYILDVSRFDPHKNILGILDAYAGLVRDGVTDQSLVFVGGRHTPDYSDEVDARIRDLGLEGRVVIAPFIEDDDMPHVYRAATFLAFPSFYEGFGMPVIEAMACGTPVLIADIPALQEVSSGVAVTVDPYDTTSIEQGMTRLIKDHDLRQRLAREGSVAVSRYTWRETGRMTAEAIRRASGRNLP